MKTVIPDGGLKENPGKDSAGQMETATPVLHSQVIEHRFNDPIFNIGHHSNNFLYWTFKSFSLNTTFFYIMKLFIFFFGIQGLEMKIATITKE